MISIFVGTISFSGSHDKEEGDDSILFFIFNLVIPLSMVFARQLSNSCLKANTPIQDHGWRDKIGIHTSSVNTVEKGDNQIKNELLLHSINCLCKLIH